MTGSLLRIAAMALLVTVSCTPRSASPLKVLGKWHTVSQGDTVDTLAQRYGADADAIAELNDLPRRGPITGREEVFVPKAGQEPPGTGAAPPAALKVKSSSGSTAEGTVGKCGVEGRPCFKWPVDGEVASTFGPRDGKHHDGLDILAKRGTAIGAAHDGTVLYSGDEIKGYGNLVLLRNEDGIITVYAHNDSNAVKEGDRVKKGQKIGEVGDTGSATATHLHFEVRLGERPRDPMLYLPTKE